MKKLLLSLLCTGLFASAAAQSVTLDRFSGSSISGIDVSGSFKVTITQGAKTSFKITIPQRYEKMLVLNHKNDGTIEVSWNMKNIKSNLDDKFEIVMVCSTLQNIDCSGGVSVNVQGAVNTPELNIDASGAFKMIANNLIVRGKLDLNISGSTKIELTGSADQCEIDASGASNVDMSMFKVRDMSVDTSGASNCTVWATAALSIESSGAAKINYKGNPTLHKEVSGGASINKL